MQSGNSIWKMTALAGCVGLGLLGLMQFQRSLSPTKTAKTKEGIRIEDFRPIDDLDSKSAKGLGDEPTEGNAEPRRLSTTKSRRPEPVEEEPLESAFDDLPPRKTSTSKSSRLPVSSDSFDHDDEVNSSKQSELASATKQRRTSRAEMSLDEFPNEVTSDEPPTSRQRARSPVFDEAPFDEDPKPTPVPRNVKKQAQELIKTARQLIDNGQLEEARMTAAEAAELPATYGPLEDTPETILAELDRLTTNEQSRTDEQRTSRSEEPIKLSGGTREDRGLSLDLDEPTFDEKPIKLAQKKSPLDDEDNLYADSPPKIINGKTRTPDPPVPPAEEDPLELPPLPDDADMPPAVPIRARHRTNDLEQPNRLKSQNASPLESPERRDAIAGDGTVRADSPRGPQRPELKIEKIAPPNATLNQPMVYTIVIRNVGDSTANAVVVEDQIPMGTKLSGTIPRAELTGSKKLIWRLGAIKPGDVKEIQVKVVPVAEGQVGSVATVNFTAEVASRTTIASPKISVKLTAAPQVRVNETVTLNFVVTNNGSVDAYRVVLRNMIPENLKLPDVAERDLEYDMGTIPAGKSQTVQLPLTAVRPGKVVNRAVISVDGASAAEQQVEINVIGQVVGLSRHGQTNWFVGRPIEFENRLTNNSLNPTNNTVVVESLPSTVEFVSASDGGRFDTRQRTVTWHVPHLDPNQTLALKIKVVPKSIGNHLGSVQVSENSRKGASTDYQFRAIGTADLKIEFTEKAEAYSKGEQFTTRMVIRNKGSGAASNVAVRLILPAELQFVSARGPASHTTSGRTIVFEPLNEIGGQGNVHFDLTLRAVQTGDTKLQVELQSNQFKKPLTHEEALVIFGAN